MIQTKSSQPTSPPKVLPGLYSAINSKNKRDISVFWKSIEPFERGGPSFSYHLTVEPHTEFGVTADETSAALTGLPTGSFSIAISSCNNVGCSESVEIAVSVEGAIARPNFLVALSQNEGGVKLYWDAVPDASDYTVLWCSESGGISQLCDRVLDVITVPGEEERLLSVQVPPGSSRFLGSSQFPVAVAANSDKASSGLLWRNCYSRASTKLKLNAPYASLRNVSSVTLDWSADCHTTYLTDSINVSVYVDGALVDSGRYKVAFNRYEEYIIVSNLEPATTYSVKLLPVFGNFPSEPSTVEVVTEMNPPTLPDSFNVSRITNSSARLDWTPPASNNADSYQFKLDSGADHVLANKTQHQLDNLLPFTGYQVSLKACNPAGCSDSIRRRFRTLVGVPLPVEKIGVQMINSSFAEVTWTPPEVLGSDSPLFQIMYVAVNQGKDLAVQNLFVKGSSVMGASRQSTIAAPVPVPHCVDHADDMYRFRVAAASNASELLVGKWSEWEVLSCTIEVDYGTLIAVIVVSVIVVSLVALLVFVVGRQVRRKWHEVCKVRVSLPSGLELVEYPLVERRSSVLFQPGVQEDDSVSLAGLPGTLPFGFNLIRTVSQLGESGELSEAALCLAADPNLVSTVDWHQTPTLSQLHDSITAIDRISTPSSDDSCSPDIHSSPYINAEAVQRLIAGESSTGDTTTGRSCLSQCENAVSSDSALRSGQEDILAPLSSTNHQTEPDRLDAVCGSSQNIGEPD